VWSFSKGMHSIIVRGIKLYGKSVVSHIEDFAVPKDNCEHRYIFILYYTVLYITVYYSTVQYNTILQTYKCGQTTITVISNVLFLREKL